MFCENFWFCWFVRFYIFGLMMKIKCPDESTMMINSHNNSIPNQINKTLYSLVHRWFATRTQLCSLFLHLIKYARCLNNLSFKISFKTRGLLNNDLMESYKWCWFYDTQVCCHIFFCALYEIPFWHCNWWDAGPSQITIYTYWVFRSSWSCIWDVFRRYRLLCFVHSNLTNIIYM